MKQIDHVIYMLDMMEYVSIKRAQRDLLSHQKIENVLGWWKNYERNLGAQYLDNLVIASFKKLYEDRYVSVAQKHHYHVEFTMFELDERFVEQYTTCFNELAIFSPQIVDNKEEIKAMYIDGL